MTRLRELALCLRSVCCAHAALRLCVRAQTISIYVSECTSIYNFMYTLLYTALAWGQPPGNVSVPSVPRAAGFFPPSALALSVPPHAHATSIVDACARVYDESAIAVHRSRHMASPPGSFASRVSTSNTSSDTCISDTVLYARYDFQFFTCSSLCNWLCRMLLVLGQIGVYQAFTSMPSAVRFYEGSKPPVSKW